MPAGAFDPSEQLDRARHFAQRSWRPFPVELANGKDPLSDDYEDGKQPQRTGPKRANGSYPRLGWGTLCASAPTEKMLALQFGQGCYNIAIAAKGSGLVILDADREGAMEALCEAYGQPVPITYRVRTRKGWHYYFDAPSWAEIGNKPGPLKSFGFDVRGGRGHGGYVVAHGSTHESGHIYTAEAVDADTMELPLWLTELLLPQPEPENVTPINGEPRADRIYSKADAATWIETYALAPLRNAVEHGDPDNGRLARNEAVNQAALVIGHFVPELCSEEFARKRVLEEARLIGYNGPEVLATVNSGLSQGIADRYTVVKEEEGDSGLFGGDGQPTGDPATAHASAVAKRLEDMKIQAEAKRLYNAEVYPPTERPEPMTLTDLLAMEMQEAKYRIEGLMGVGGRVLLAAAHKAGKTTLVTNTVRSLVDGTPLLGRYEVQPIEGNLILLDTELPQRLLHEWYGGAGIVNTGKVVVISLRDKVTSFNLTDPDVLAEWVDALGKLDPGFLVLDCLRPVLDACGLDEKTEVGKFLVPFGELLGKLGVQEALVVQHMGHSGERARGDSVLLGWPDANWKLVRREAEDDRSTRYFSAFGRDVDVEECELGINSMTRELSIVGGTRKDAVAAEVMPDLLAWLTEHPGSPGAAIETGLLSDYSHSTHPVRAAVKLAIKEKRVEVKPGPRGARLHSVRSSSSARQSSSDELG